MIKKLLFYSLLPVFFLFNTFSISVSESISRDFSEADTLVQMERTICFGTCPSYTLSILENGKITFNGRDFVEHQGEATGMMSQENLDQLKRTIRESHFMDIPANPECKTQYTDHSSVFLTIQLDEKQHSITHYQGCKGFQYEEELYDLEEAIDSLAGTDRWIEGEE